MSVIILGGNECMERQYKELCKSYNCKAKIFIKPSGSLKNKLGNPDLMICFTGAKCSRTRRMRSADAALQLSIPRPRLCPRSAGSLRNTRADEKDRLHGSAS